LISSNDAIFKVKEDEDPCGVPEKDSTPPDDEKEKPEPRFEEPKTLDVQTMAKSKTMRNLIADQMMRGGVLK